MSIRTSQEVSGKEGLTFARCSGGVGGRKVEEVDLLGFWEWQGTKDED